MNPQRPHLIRVQSWRDVSPHLRRIVFHSPDLSDYPAEHGNGAPLKILLPREAGQTPELPEWTSRGARFPEGAVKPFARTYTLRDFDAEECTLTIDFVLHGDNGPASAFAEHVSVGQTIGVSAPRSREPILKAADAYWIAGDLTAMPAIESMIAAMKPDAVGDVFLLLPEGEGLPDTFEAPANVGVHIFEGDARRYQALIEAAAAAKPEAANCYYWIAAEAAMTADLRQLVRGEWQIPLARCHAVPYWRAGDNEEKYHQQRHAFMDEDKEENRTGRG